MSYVEEMFDLSGTRAIITGGAGAIAGGFAEALLKAGTTVALWGHRQSTIDEAVQRLSGVVPEGRERLAGFQADTGKDSDVRAALAATEKAVGPPNLLINGVGGTGGPKGKSAFADTDMEIFESVLKLNVIAGLMIPTKLVAAYWIERKIKGSIINITSMSSYVPLSGVWGYGAAKAGVLNLTQAAAKEFAPYGIRVNAIAPGFVIGKQNRALLIDEKTGELTARGKAIIAHTPFGRFSEASELAGALLFLASEKASGFVTGISLPVDGGYLVHNI